MNSIMFLHWRQQPLDGLCLYQEYHPEHTRSLLRRVVTQRLAEEDQESTINQLFTFLSVSDSNYSCVQWSA